MKSMKNNNVGKTFRTTHFNQSLDKLIRKPSVFYSVYTIIENNVTYLMDLEPLSLVRMRIYN